ncbi:MAG TPA: hypothetical protein VNH19_17520 [Candidatus Limnocylindrales bacterium]|nr:hypothetical protein [Bryobacteraceae bacterium]HXJ14079.1 hypothetical protein [Candidatus Limnocylindrales bacterium]
MTELPDPLVPADCDLRGLQWMPYYGAALAGSDFNAAVSDAGYRAAHNLWWACWQQVPAASLPNDDIALARFADLGRDVKRWKKLKTEALHAFLLCSDGRLYHRFLAKLALETFRRRLTDRNRKKKWQEERGSPASENAEIVGGNAEKRKQNGSLPSSHDPSDGAEIARTARATEDRTVILPSLKGRISNPARAHARANGKSDLDLEGDPFGRCAPLRGGAAPLRGKALAKHRKDQLVQKVMRFAIATMNDRDRMAAIEGLTGLDNEHSAQWWLDTLDLKMRGARWDDTE